MRVIIHVPQSGTNIELDADGLALQPNGAYALVQDGQPVAFFPPDCVVYYPDGPTKILQAKVVALNG